MFTVDFSSYRYVAGRIVFVKEIALVEYLDDALGMAPSATHIGLANPAHGYTPDVIRTAHAREWVHEPPDAWPGSRFECIVPVAV